MARGFVVGLQGNEYLLGGPADVDAVAVAVAVAVRLGLASFGALSGPVKRGGAAVERLGLFRNRSADMLKMPRPPVWQIP